MWLAVPDRRLSAASPSSSSSAVSTPQLGFDSAQHQQHQQQQHQVGSRQDKSWRVWDMVVNQLYELCDAVGPEATRSDLVPAHVRLQRDNEAEVRIAATGKVSKFCRILNPELAIQQILLPIAFNTMKYSVFFLGVTDCWRSLFKEWINEK